jgi:hypothetical protein
MLLTVGAQMAVPTTGVPTLVTDSLQGAYNITVQCPRCTWVAAVQRREPCARRPPQDAVCLPLTVAIVMAPGTSGSEVAPSVTISLPLPSQPALPMGTTLMLVPVDGSGAACAQQVFSRPDGARASLTATGCPAGEYTLLVRVHD